MDSHYHKPEFRILEANLREKYPGIQRLDSYSEVLCGPFGTEITLDDYQETGVPLLRISNVTAQGTIDESELAFLNPEKAATLSSTQVRPRDLVISQRGTLGMPAVVPSSYSLWNISANLIAIRNVKDLLPDFVQLFVSTRPGAFQLERSQSGQVQGKITTEDAASILIPFLKDQCALVSEMEAAREMRRRKLAEADALLSGLEALLLDRLGLTPKKTSFPRFFSARLKDAWGRCDPDYHSPKFKELRGAIEASGYPVYDLGTLAPNPRTGFAAGREVQAFDEDEGIPHVRPLNVTKHGELTFEGTKLVPRNAVHPNDMLRPGEVLLNNTNSTEWVGKTTVFEGQRECCCSNHITRLTPDRSLVIPWFLGALLNAVRSTGYLGLLATNFVNQAGINMETLSSLRLPAPPLNMQEKIVAELTRRRLEARRLREEAAREWEAAKARFEARLLGGEAAQ